ncbi:uncharacterized protein LOC129959253 [Argiope bruennichi]|uniref:Uncharacterized protein n=1 Tax=Argiope bruennichi TaxID=94029 RepID=A0A8T0F458_ARGBR|nr:uncharacterized protein LOC129959253 [Argiope bruennichi]KAF8785048.1 hypothetical protein HNY73_010644 [Argiope bruennichi]
MDSLDALPSADYASLITLSPPNDASEPKKTDASDEKEAARKYDQEHIYAQVAQITPCPEIKRLPPPSKDHRKRDSSEKKVLLHNTYVLRNPSVNLIHANSTPDVNKSSSNIPNLCPNNYGSLNVTKLESNKKIILQKSETTIDPSVFSISGRRVVVSSGFKVNGVKKNENVPKELDAVSNHSEGSASLWSQSPSTDSQIELKRHKLQFCTECCSLCLFVPGTVLCVLGPWLFVPIYIIPNFSGSHFQTLILITCICSAILVFMSCLIGNVVWYRKGKDWKCLLHCGKGPKNHYWGDSLTSRALHTV